MKSERAIWVITSYFNPGRYRRRLENFRQFRNALQAPLLAVELGFDDHFQLSKSDADVLFQLSGNSVLWQKERLLNVALAHLPPKVPYVAWIDCDVVFSDDSWSIAAIDALQRHRLVQLFEYVVDLEPQSTHSNGQSAYTARALAACMNDSGTEARESSLPMRDGGGWAGHRSLLEKHGFYDAMIMGGGDSALAFAAYGEYQRVLSHSRMNRAQTSHYLEWAHPFFADVQGDVGFLPGVLFHYWHGRLPDRLYSQRHEQLMLFDFNPYVDIKISQQGTFEWSSPKQNLHRHVRNYWSLRNEDG